MDYAIRLASRNLGNTGENPSVGCVITSDNEIISIGVTGRNGSPHAEYNAINKIKNCIGTFSIPLNIIPNCISLRDFPDKYLCT